MTPPQPSCSFNGETLFLVQGVISELQTARTTVNLLEKMELRLRSENLTSGVAAVVTGMHGMLANSAMLLFYDGEDMFNFAGLIGDDVVCGVFEQGDKLKNGDSVLAVASKRGDVLSIHSILRTDDQLLLTPLNVYAGKKAFLRNCIKFTWRVCLAGWIIMGATVIALFYGRGMSDAEILFFMLAGCFITPPLIMIPMEYMTYRSMCSFAERASAIFKVFGFPRPDDLDIRIGLKYYSDHSDGYIGINCDLALQKHKAKFQ